MHEYVKPYQRNGVALNLLCHVLKKGKKNGGDLLLFSVLCIFFMSRFPRFPS